MMYTGQIDLWTFFFYHFLGICAVMCMSRAKRITGVTSLTHGKKIKTRYGYYVLFVFIYTFAATFRKIGDNLGGSDSVTYIQFFFNIHNPDSPYMQVIDEPLFHLYCYILRFFTDDHRVVFALSYGLIAISYCAFIEKFCPKCGVFTPFLMLIFPFLRSFCTLRTGIAVAVFLLAITCFEKNRLISILLLTTTVFIHRMSIMFAVFPIFYWMFQKKIPKLSGIRLSLFLFLMGFLGVWLARGLQYLVINLELLQSQDQWYVSQSLGISLVSRFPMYFMHLLLFIVMSVCMEKTRQGSRDSLLKILCCYDIIIMPAALILGVWRANEYLYVARLVMWTTLIPKGEDLIRQIHLSIKSSNRYAFMSKLTEKHIQTAYRLGVTLLIVAWLSFRIYSEWEELKIMPYVLDFTKFTP